jgi:hypothetical protein
MSATDVRAAWQALVGQLSGWVEAEGRREEVARGIASLKRYREEFEWLRGLNSREPWQEERFRLLAPGADADRARQAGYESDETRLTRLQGGQQQHQKATEDLRQAEDVVFRFAERHGIDATPLTRLLVFGELDRYQDALLVLRRVGALFDPSPPAGQTDPQDSGQEHPRSAVVEGAGPPAPNAGDTGEPAPAVPGAETAPAGPAGPQDGGQERPRPEAAEEARLPAPAADKPPPPPKTGQADAKTPLELVPGGFRLYDLVRDLPGKPRGVLRSLLGARYHRRTFGDLRDEVWDQDSPAAEQNVKDAVKSLRNALREAYEEARGAALAEDPVPCIGKGRDLAWELRLDLF